MVFTANGPLKKRGVNKTKMSYCGKNQNKGLSFSFFLWVGSFSGSRAGGQQPLNKQKDYPTFNTLFELLRQLENMT